MNFLKNLLMIVLLLVVLGVIAWVVVSIGFSCAGPANTPDIPAADEAAYSVTIENTGKLILANDYEVLGSEVGSRVFVLHGRWEFLGQDFKYKSEDLVLDESIFGEITLKRR